MSSRQARRSRDASDERLEQIFSKMDDQEAADRLRAEFKAAAEKQERLRKVPPAARPKGRTTPIAVRFDEFTLTRLRALAARRNTGYQTLLKDFVVERLYEEEKREGIIIE
jgi:hypothetical protein